MGNRAHIIFKAGNTISPAIYLHWNGGPDTIYPALAELERRKVRTDAHYQSARFVGLMHELFMPEQLSLGMVNGPSEISAHSLLEYDHGDNGVYVIESFSTSRTVRRFISGRELTPEEVQAEKEQADFNPAYSQMWKNNFKFFQSQRSA